MQYNLCHSVQYTNTRKLEIIAGRQIKPPEICIMAEFQIGVCARIAIVIVVVVAVDVCTK